MLGTTPPTEDQDRSGYDWSEIDLDRHVRLAEHASGVLETIRASLWDLEAILRDFAAAAGAAGMALNFRRDPDALLWTLSLVGPAVRATGTVAVTLDAPTSATIISRPDGHEARQWQAVIGGTADLLEQLKTDFRAAAVAAVFEATGVISTSPAAERPTGS